MHSRILRGVRVQNVYHGLATVILVDKENVHTPFVSVQVLFYHPGGGFHLHAQTCILNHQYIPLGGGGGSGQGQGYFTYTHSHLLGEGKGVLI